jgi:lipopolysaccharide/colanic/teichoic acid biosynthesis glycosyltransferase
MDVKEKEAEIIVSNNETALVQPQQYIPEKTDSLLIGKIFKRLIDILGGIVGTFVLIPLTIGIAIANLICKDNGPIFYSQYRMGKNGKLFKMYKYRSMVVGADEKLKKYLEENEEARKEYKKYKKLKHDPRVTKVGEFIRKTSLDEFPQFINVLKGDMSLVGPRPYLEREKEDMNGYYKYITTFKPGLTGLWQISGRSDVDFVTRIDLDMQYYYNHSLKGDIKILFKTAMKLVKREGAL